MLTSMNSKIIQQSAMINELLRCTKKAMNAVEKPHGTPNFPLRTLEEFNHLESLLGSNDIIRDYMV